MGNRRHRISDPDCRQTGQKAPSNSSAARPAASRGLPRGKAGHETIFWGRRSRSETVGASTWLTNLEARHVDRKHQFRNGKLGPRAVVDRWRAWRRDLISGVSGL